MRLFISEYICSGALTGEDLPSSLAVEGQAMRDSVIEDFADLPDVEVVTTCDERVPTPRAVDSIPVSSPEDEIRVFQQLAEKCDATYIIAPEFDGILSHRCENVEAFSPRPLNCMRTSVELASDKLLLATHLHAAGVHTIPTKEWFAGEVPEEFPCVIKPRDGAGSQGTFLCHNTADWNAMMGALGSSESTGSRIIQPYMPGRALSVAAIVDPETGQASHLFPVAEQHLSGDGKFRYEGGSIPADGIVSEAIAEIIHATSIALPGLRGYVGFDLILPRDGQEPVLVEVNPRLTTSYVGYRQLTSTNLAGLILNPQTDKSIDWISDPVTFRHDGHVTRSRRSSAE